MPEQIIINPISEPTQHHIAQEKLECKYLKKYYHLLCAVEDEILDGFNSKEAIRNDWEEHWDNSKSDFADGAERIVYSLINGRGFGNPCNVPVGSDLVFETNDAFIHIDMKTAQVRNKGDIMKQLSCEHNQTSYESNMLVTMGPNKGTTRFYKGHLPHRYTTGSTGSEVSKPTVTFFIICLHDDVDKDCLFLSIISKPNGMLYPIYGDSIMVPGKNFDPIVEGRFRFIRCPQFLTLKNEKRIKTIYYDEELCNNFDLEINHLIT